MPKNDMLSYLPGIVHRYTDTTSRPRPQLLRNGILYHASRESLTARQIAHKLGITLGTAKKEITNLKNDGKLIAITTMTVTYDLQGRGRKTHSVRIYRTVR